MSAPVSRRRSAGWLLLFFGLCSAILLLFHLSRSLAGWSVDVGAPGDRLFLTGFYAPESSDGTSFRWSGTQSQLLLHGASVAPQILALRLNGDLLSQREDTLLRLARGEQEIAALSLAPGWRTYRLLLPAGTAVTGGRGGGWAAPLDFAVDAYCPTTADNRVLGVPLDWLQVAPTVQARSTGAIWRAVATSLTWALLLTGALFVSVQALKQLNVRTFKRWSIWLPTVFVLAHGLLLPWLPVAWRGTGAWLLLLLPGALLAWLFLPHDTGSLQAGFLALCGGLALVPLLLLPLQALPGPLPWWGLLLVCDGLALVGWLLWRSKNRERGTENRERGTENRLAVPLLLVLLAAAALRLIFLGSAEFQGDEARAMIMAMGVRHGQDEILLLHRKGPVEALLPAAPLVLTGHVNEWVARLPFALAGIGAVAGSALLAWRMLGGYGITLSTLAGLLAAAVVALAGFLIAFSRIVQYQSIVVCMAVGALLCGWHFYEGTQHPRRWLVGAAVLAAVGLLSHYDGIYVLPALAWLVLAGGRQYWRGWQWARGLALPLLVGAGLLLSFYLPFVLHEHFSRTVGYLAERTGDEPASLLVNNLPGYYERATFYNTTFQITGLAVVLLVGVLVWLVQYRPLRPGLRITAWLLVALLLVGCALLLLAPGAFEQGKINLALLFFAAPLLGLVLFPRTPAALRVLVLWFALPFIAHSFLVADPRTHFYTMDVPAALLIGLALAQLVSWLRSRHALAWLQIPLIAGGTLLLLLTLPYLSLLYLQQSPEYYRTFPAARPAIYRAGYGDEVPGGGHFGFPHRDGWKVIGELYRQGALQGSYNTNQRDRVGTWYTRGAFQCQPVPDAYLLATWDGASLRAQSNAPRHGEDYQRAACVLVDGRRMLDIYTRKSRAAPPLAFRLEDYRAAFDAQPVPHFPMQETMIQRVPQHHLDISWQRDIRLAGYDLDRARLAPGQLATLSLYWETAEPLTADYMPVLELLSSDGINGILVREALPLCNPASAAAWSPHYLNTTAFTVWADARLSPGSYALRVSLRHAETGEPLPLTDGATSVQIASLMVEGQQAGETSLHGNRESDH